MPDEPKNSVHTKPDAEYKEARLELIYEIGGVLASAESVEIAAPQILEAICRRLNFDLGELWIIRENQHKLSRQSVWHQSSEQLTAFVGDSREYKFALGEGLPGKVWQRNAPVWIESLIREPDLARRQSAEHAGLHSAFAFPIRLGEKFLGAFCFFCRDVCPPDAELLKMFVAVGGNIGNFIKRERAENRLRESNAALQIISQNSPTLIYMKDRAGRMLNANRAMLEILGKTSAQVIGKTVMKYTDDEAAAALIADNDRRIIESGVTETLEDEIHVKNVRRTFLSTKTPYRGANGEIIGLVGISFDITERKQIEVEREKLLALEHQAREISEQANRAKDEFIALVSHELRSPLNAMLGWSRILQEQKSDAQITEHALNVIVRNGLSQARLIEDLLDIARLDKGKLRLEITPLNLAPIIETALETVRPEIESKQIKLTVNLDEAANPAAGDEDRLRQVFENLLSNAVKFTTNGGSVGVRLRAVGAHAEIIISDDGQGISADFLPQIFERFRQADASNSRRHGGLGIGLSLARDLIELHDGTITAHSAGENKGTIFTVLLPLRIV